MNRAKARILIADDESLFGTTTARFLERHGYFVRFVPDGLVAASELGESPFDLLIADLDMPGNRGLELLATCRSAYPEMPLIVVTGRPTLPSAIEGIRLGLHDYFLKPLELDDLLHSVRRALPPPKSEPPAGAGFDELLGESDAMQRLKQSALRIARSHATVLIRGESGTGKELLARGIHRTSQRSTGPFVTVDCAAIPESLLESTLFGHRRGAFTGAIADRRGLIESADGGTLFLDEVGELPLTFQAKLLRVLQFGTFTPVGASSPVQADVRILAATHRHLAEEVQQGTFRLDLYYRISVLEILCPSLADRLEDLPQLTSHFLARIAQRDDLPRKSLAPEAMQLLTSHNWPGNVRELENTMERAACLAAGNWIDADSIAASLQRLSNDPLPPHRKLSGDRSTHEEHLAEQERRYLMELLRRHRGNITRAAQEARMSRQGLHKALSRLGIEPIVFR